MQKNCHRTFYDDAEFDYHDYWLGRDYEDLAERQALEYFYKLIGVQNTLVDIGCGYGRLASSYKPWCKKAILVEPALKNLQSAVQDLGEKSGLHFVQSTAEQICLSSQCANTVQMIRVAHHCLDLKQVFSQVHRILQSPGWFIMEFPNKMHALMTIKHWASGDFSFRRQLNSIDRRSNMRRNNDVIPFMNHHPGRVLDLLTATGFTVEKCISVSNLRRANWLPLSLSLPLDRLMWNMTDPIWWGPSIFVLAKKS